MQGQRFHKDLKRDEIFKDYLETHGNCRKLNNSIQHIGRKKFQEEAMSEKRLSAITNRIIILEKRISVEMDAAAQWYVNECFYFWSRKFRSQIRKINTKSKEALVDYKNILNEILNEIIQTFNKGGFIRIYSMTYPLEEVNKKIDLFELIGDSSNLNNIAYSWLEFKPLPLTSCVIEKEELLKYLKVAPSDFNATKDVFRLEAPFDSKKAYIIWKRYDNVVHYNHFEMYCDALKSMYNTLLESYFILYSIKLEQKLEASIRISVHESAQIIPSCIDVINTKESLDVLVSGKEYNGNPSISIPMHSILDVSNRLLLLEGLFSRSSLIFKKDPPKYEWHDFHRIIYAIKSMFSSKVSLQNLQTLTIDSNRKFSQYRIYTDYGYLSHALFNLMDNAIKYGLRGTRIKIKIDIEHDKLMENIFNNTDIIKYIHISVISYGPEISETTRNHMYDLYYRDSPKEIEGMGIGLFLTKKLCNLMGYTVTCENSCVVSKINIPVHYCFHNRTDIDTTLLNSECLQILKKQIPQNTIEETVNPNCVTWELTEPEIMGLISIPTCRNEFKISIPINENNLVIN